MQRVGRNEPCPCGSGKKFKRCCTGNPFPRYQESRMNPIIEPNGTPTPPPALPTIEVGWDEKAQDVRVQFDNTEFRSWVFVIATLEMAVAKAEQMKKMAEIAAMQQQALANAQNQAIANQLRRRGP